MLRGEEAGRFCKVAGGGGGGLMRGIKIPQQDFALKMMQGGLMHEGGHICGTLRCTCVPRPA